MSNRRRLDRERLEYYLTYLILAYRRLIFIAGLLLLIYAITALFINIYGGIVALIPAIYLLALSNSYNITVYTARLGAWIGMLWRQDD
ncbi:MAG TPA: hypothetical protein VIS72_16305 [Anaerolineales bacterium]